MLMEETLDDIKACLEHSPYELLKCLAQEIGASEGTMELLQNY
jgi:hypothetical protein